MSKCLQCNMEMVPVEFKYRTWKCPICSVRYRKRSNLQFHMEHIAMLDQMIAGEDNPKIKKILEERLKEAEAYKEHCDELEKKGVTFGDLEEWSDGLWK